MHPPIHRLAECPEGTPSDPSAPVLEEATHPPEGEWESQSEGSILCLFFSLNVHLLVFQRLSAQYPEQQQEKHYHCFFSEQPEMPVLKTLQLFLKEARLVFIMYETFLNLFKKGKNAVQPTYCTDNKSWVPVLCKLIVWNHKHTKAEQRLNH